MTLQSTAQKRNTSPVLVCVAATCALSSCSTEENGQGYTVPEMPCEYSVSNDVADFLPPGNDISIHRNTHSSTTVCEVAVDRKLVLTTTTAWRSAEDSTASFTQRALDILQHSADKGRFRYSDYEAFGKARNCVAHEGDRALYTAVQAVGSKHRDAEAMKRLIESFTAAVEASQECRSAG